MKSEDNTPPRVRLGVRVHIYATAIERPIPSWLGICGIIMPPRGVTDDEATCEGCLYVRAHPVSSRGPS